MSHRGVSFIFLVGGLSCSSSPPAAIAVAALPQGVAARVGTTEIATESVARVAAARGVSVQEARALLIRDALFAQAALAGGGDSLPATRAALRARLARAVLSEIRARAASSPPTDDEVEKATARHFVELDRPEAFRVVHAVAKLPRQEKDPDGRQRARSLADRLSKAVAGAHDAAEFRARADALPRADNDVEVIVEELQPVAADGRVVDLQAPPAAEPARYAPRFAAAASKLARPGDQSPVVETEFGFHVLMLLDRTPPKTLPLEERRSLLTEEIQSERARTESEATTRRLRERENATVERSADAILSAIRILSP